MESLKAAQRAWRSDPRHPQIAALSLLLLYGVFFLRFDLMLERVAATLFGAILAQAICTRLLNSTSFEWRSALISGLGLCLLLRTDSWLLAAAAPALAIGSKSLIRIRGRHMFNPTNFAIVALMLGTGGVWVSPGQWGHAAFFGYLAAGMGILVASRSARIDVALALLFFHAGFLFYRAAKLGDPLAIPLHQLQNGGLLIFAFHMISDPKTTPQARSGRILFAFLVAFGAWYVQFKLFRPHGLILSLAAFSPLVPLIDALLPGQPFDWKNPFGRKAREEGEKHETHPDLGPALPELHPMG